MFNTLIVVLANPSVFWPLEKCWLWPSWLWAPEAGVCEFWNLVQPATQRAPLVLAHWCHYLLAQCVGQYCTIRQLGYQRMPLSQESRGSPDVIN